MFQEDNKRENIFVTKNHLSYNKSMDKFFVNIRNHLILKLKLAVIKPIKTSIIKQLINWGQIVE